MDLKDLASIASTPISQDLGKHLVQKLFTCLFKSYGPKMLQDLWIDSKVEWIDFIINPEEIDTLISHNVR